MLGWLTRLSFTFFIFKINEVRTVYLKKPKFKIIQKGILNLRNLCECKIVI